MNEWILVPAAAAVEHVGMPEGGEPGAPGPFAFADAGRVTGILEGAGLTGVAVDEVAASMTIGTSVDDAVAYFRTTDFAAGLMNGVEEERATRAWEAIGAALESHVGADGVQLLGRAWLVTAKRPG